MDTLSSIAAILFAVFLIWMLARYLRANPKALSWDNINKSLYSMGMLGLVLIVFLGVVVWLLRQS